MPNAEPPNDPIGDPGGILAMCVFFGGVIGMLYLGHFLASIAGLSR